MKKEEQNRFKLVYPMCLTYLLLLVSLTAAAQDMHPGDANDNGIVNGVDVLYVGKVFGQTGLVRPDASPIFESQAIDPWSTLFPNGLNHAYADSDGNSIIQQEDIDIIGSNYGLIQSPVTPDAYQADGTFMVDPLLTLEPLSSQVNEGEGLEMRVILGDATTPILDFHGISFSVIYDPAALQAVNFNILEGGGGLVNSLNAKALINTVSPGIVNVAVTRINGISGSGFGSIGVLNFIIVDDFISALPVDSFFVTIDSVMVLDKNLEPFNPYLIQPSGVQVIENPSVHTVDYSQQSNLKIYPNPIATNHSFTIETDGLIIQNVVLRNPFGQPIALSHDESMTVFQIDNQIACPSGIYYLEIATNKGRETRRLFVL